MLVASTHGARHFPSDLYIVSCGYNLQQVPATLTATLDTQRMPVVIGKVAPIISSSGGGVRVIISALGFEWSGDLELPTFRGPRQIPGTCERNNLACKDSKIQPF